MQTGLDYDIDYEPEIDWDEWKCPKTKAEVDEELYQLILSNDKSAANIEKRIQCMGWLYDHGYPIFTAGDRIAIETKATRVTGDRVYHTPKAQVKPCTWP